MARGLPPESEATRKALRWIVDQRHDEPRRRLGELLDEAGLRFDLTPIEQESLRALLTLVPTDA